VQRLLITRRMRLADTPLQYTVPKLIVARMPKRLQCEVGSSTAIGAQHSFRANFFDSLYARLRVRAISAAVLFRWHFFRRRQRILPNPHSVGACRRRESAWLNAAVCVMPKEGQFDPNFLHKPLAQPNDGQGVPLTALRS